MSKPKSPTRINTELNELKKKIRDAVNTVNGAKEDRAESNAVIAEAMASMEAKGIPRKALQWAMTYSEWDSDARAGFDVAYQIVREAIGVPMEDELFNANGEPNLKIPAIAEESEKHDAASGKTPAEGIAEHVLDEAKKATGQRTIN
jgi:chaperonin GroEL (HSP60 family)